MSTYILKSEEQTLYEYIVYKSWHYIEIIIILLIKMIDHSVESKNNIYQKVEVQY